MKNVLRMHLLPDKQRGSRSRLLGVFAGSLYLLGLTTASAAPLDPFGPPPPGDPSEFTNGMGVPGDDDSLLLLDPANAGSFEGGPTGTFHDAGIDNSVPENEQEPRLLVPINVPSNGKPSPRFGAKSFTQKMLRFEEFGTHTLDAAGPVPLTGFPLPNNAASMPDGGELDTFLGQPGIAPFPTEYANTLDENPWKSEIENFLGRVLDTPPAEGRPPGKGWAHQRWNEFYPEVFFKTAQTGARTNGGLRDSSQRHGYRHGLNGEFSEFGRRGLYHNTVGKPGFNATTQGTPVRFHPKMPIQAPEALWTFDGTLPPKLLMARHGQSLMWRHYNALPIDPSANRGFGLHTLTTHEHNGHTPAESDGYTNAFFFPGQFYDYRWPMQLAGHDSINTDANDPRAAFPCTAGETLFVNDGSMTPRTCENGSIRIRGDWRETMSTHWFHDHMLDFTAQNVYKGNAAMMNYYSALDRGNEAYDDGVNLRFPSGTALDWGNRDYDVNLLIADKAWDQDGQLWFNIFNRDGFIGDRILTNWLFHPFMKVRARSYRFRILNGAVSRYFTFALVQEVQGNGGELPGRPNSGVSYNRVPFHMIANDGNIMEHTVPFDGTMDLNGNGNADEHKGVLPTQAIAERYDIIVDFSKHGIQVGDRLYMVNLLEHTTGETTGDKIPLADVLSGAYRARAVDEDGDKVRDVWVGGDPGVGRFLQFRVMRYDGQDLSMDPTQYEPGGQKMIPLTIDRDDESALANATHRTFDFGTSSGTDENPWTIKSDGGTGLSMDPRRISAAPQLATGPTDAGTQGEGTLEVWRLENSSGASHPIHIHFEEGVILRRGGLTPPEWEKWARKDVYRIGREEDSTDEVELAIRFREFAGTYMEHCHNTQHEDNAMLLRWDLEHPGQVLLMPTPMPTWDGVEYVDSAALPTIRSGDGVGPNFGGVPEI